MQGKGNLKFIKMASYKTCAVPMCKNTTVKAPNKLYIHVPICRKRRKQWLQLARRNPDVISDKTVIYFCQDHFDLPNDMENYIKYSVMGSVRRVRMKPDCLPSKFHCQLDRIKGAIPPQPRSAVNKKGCMDITQEILAKETETPATSGITSNSDIPSTEKNDCSNFDDLAKQVDPEATNKLIQTPNNMGNYMENHLMGSVSQVRMKIRCMPKSYQCQSDRRKTSDATELSYIIKKQRKTLVEECIKDLEENTVSTKQVEWRENSPCSSAENVENNKLNNDIVCMGCKKMFQGCMLMCVQCPGCVWCAQCAELSSHARHYLVQVPAGRPQTEIDEVINTIKALISKHSHLDIKIEAGNNEFCEKNLIKEEQYELNEIEDWNLREEVKTEPCDLDVGQVTRDEEIVLAVKSEVEEEDPLLATAGDETRVMLIKSEPYEATMNNLFYHTYQPIPAETYTCTKNDHPNKPTFETFTNLDPCIPVLTPEEMTDESYITRNGTRSNVRKGRAKEKGDPLLIAHKKKPTIRKRRKKK